MAQRPLISMLARSIPLNGCYNKAIKNPKYVKITEAFTRHYIRSYTYNITGVIYLPSFAPFLRLQYALAASCPAARTGPASKMLQCTRKREPGEAFGFP